MGELLQSKEMDKIEELFKVSFDLNSELVFFPIRHHSPACAYHLRDTINEYSPEVILIEGPYDGNEIIDFLSYEENKAPFAIYYSYCDSKEKYRCYYPFLDYSPELVAIREGKKKNIKTEFIDLSYGDILANSVLGKGLLKRDDKLSYNDDYLLFKNRFIESVLKKENCRDFNEFWEKDFEVKGLSESKEVFVRDILSYCYLSRLYSKEEELLLEGCIQREAFMAQNIKKACLKYKKVLVVTGGFHTYGIIKLLNTENKFKLKKANRSDTGVYVMPYSMEALDSLNGYASGMPYPNFYEEVWKNIEKSSDKPYEEAVLLNLIETGKLVRKNDGCLSTFDEICAFDMAGGLSSLREKNSPGVYELIDSVISSFIKGDLNVATKGPLEILYKHIRGNKVGSLCSSFNMPPLYYDFKNTTDKYKLKVNISLRQELSLDIFSSKRHRKISCFMYRMQFLNTDFCNRVKGPNIILKKNLNLVREIWNYRWSAAVDSALIENSVYGGTLKEATTYIIRKRLKDTSSNSAMLSKILVDTFNMGLDDAFSLTIDCLEKVISEDGNIYSLIECMYYLNYISSMKELYFMDSIIKLEDIIFSIYSKACILIKGIANIPEEETLKGINALKELFNIVLNRELKIDDILLKEALISLIKVKDVNAGIEGAAYGILYGMNEFKQDKIKKAVEGYILGTKGRVLNAPKFLNGLFSTARDLVFVESSILKAIDKFLNTVTDEEFFKIMPELRLAFSYFIPREIDEIGEKVAGICNINKKHFDSLEDVSSDILKLGSYIDVYAMDKMKEEGFLIEQYK
ncbi:DUF5682 family protein [Clostridium felsineum]|uniref:DUF5682 family protein n=1 Tax=Clostridium felsineum TaxID=36839 RepID=UPI00098C3366|nr:DUF5682 family protein [Clostridium felsineum]URZ00393.1 hypothetical protein CLAUR_003810 [Clostridium felsineum]